MLTRERADAPTHEDPGSVVRRRIDNAPGAGRTLLARSRTLGLVIHLNVLWLYPHDLSVLPRGHRVAQRLVQAPSVTRGLAQRIVDGAAVLEELFHCGLVVS